jgi:uncharacterized protein YlxW (UPF0749 family)
MSQRSPFHRLFSLEVLAGALAGAAAPYLVALFIEVAPNQVPIWLVALCLAAGSVLTWLARVVRSNRKQSRATREREHLELKAQLENLNEAVANISTSRRTWPRRRSS